MEFPKTKGGLWSHEKTSEKQPDVKGHVEITRDVLLRATVSDTYISQAKPGLQRRIKMLWQQRQQVLVMMHHRHHHQLILAKIRGTKI